jgi:hypothetical protein
MSAPFLRSAASRDEYFLREFTNACIAQPPERGAGFHKNLLSNDGDILPACG